MARILIIDDEPDILSILNVMLGAEGHEIKTVGGGEEAREIILSSEAFDVMLSDVRMRPISGMHFLKLAHENHPEMAVIMLTAYGSEETIARAKELGAFGYVQKPFKLDELLDTVRRAVESRGNPAAGEEPGSEG